MVGGPGVVVVLLLSLAAAATVGVFGRPGRTDVEQANLSVVKSRLKRLSEACDHYHLNNGESPPSLAALTMEQPCGAPPLLSADLLKDPWGHRWGYDPSGSRNALQYADIWCKLPDGQVIGNWEGSR